MKNKKIKRDAFLEGALIATLAMVISKVLGVIYVIPFKKAVGLLGGALYGYAYMIYNIFLNLSTAGIPFAMSRLISEYNTKGYVKSKERIFKIGCLTLGLLGFLSFLIIFFAAPLIAKAILGTASGGNTVGDVTLVIRIISFLVILVPIMSVYRGYFQGHNYIRTTSYSQILEQFFRVLIIIIVSVLAIRVMKIPEITVVSITLIAAIVGALISFLYLYIKKRRHLREFNDYINPDEVLEDDKKIFVKMWAYALPFITLNIFKSIYSSIDAFILVRLLPSLFNFAKASAEIVSSVISNWGLKFNMVIISVATGIMTALVPNISKSMTDKNYSDIRLKVNQSIEILLFFSLPLAAGLSFLSEPVWNIFYGPNQLATTTYKFFVFLTVFSVVFTTISMIMQTMGENKFMFKAMIIAFLTKVITNIPFMYAFNTMSLPPYYGALASTMLGYLVGTLICFKKLGSKYQVDFSKPFIIFIDVLTSTLIMILAMNLLKFIVPFKTLSKSQSFMTIVIYTLFGSIVFLISIKRKKIIKHIVGDDKYKKIKKKFKFI